jgi:hypothetical protein
MLGDSFLISTNASGTIEFSGFEDLIHNTDESDNPQDLAVLYLISLNVDRKLQANSDPGVDNITLTPTDILPEWVASHAYSLNDMVQPTTPNGYRYKCTTAGTSSGTEPGSWPLTVGSTVSSGTAVFTNISNKHEITEVTLALSPGDLATNTPGGALSLGNTVLGGVANAVAIYVRVENNVNIVSNNSTFPEIAIRTNALDEWEI